MISKFEKEGSIEVYITTEPSCRGGLFKDQFKSMWDNYEKSCKENGLTKDTLIYIKLYLSDITNQVSFINDFFEGENVLYYMIGQAPASSLKVSLEAYHITLNVGAVKKNYDDKKLTYSHGNYVSHIGEISSKTGNEKIKTSFEQTTIIFEQFQTELKKSGCSMLDNVERVWFYIRDIDRNYQGLVDSRNQYFDMVGLTSQTHYLASTGIEGTYVDADTLVMMNYIFTEGLDATQVEYMTAVEVMCPTHIYNVAFERGAKVRYGDRAHYYISGTASIDAKGNILYENNIFRQIDCALGNIECLLKGSNADMEDLKLIIVYLRDFSDYDVVKNELLKRFGESLPFVIVQASVCRPGWLIEIEGIAINADGDERYGNFI